MNSIFEKSNGKS
jgi:hypothetical protein